MKDLLTGLIRAVIILVVLLVIFNLLKPVIYGGQSEENPKYNEEGEEQQETIKINYDNKHNYEEIYEKYNFEYVEEIFGSEFLDYYYKSKTFSDEFYMFTSIANLTKNKFTLVCKNSVKIDAKTVNNKVKELYGDVDFLDVSYTTGDKNLAIKYNSNDKTYTVENSKCSGIDIRKGYIETKFLGGVEKENTIEIYENAHLVKQTETNGILKTQNYRGVVESTGLATNNSYDIYKYVFEKNDSSFTLIKIEKQ